MPMMITLGTDAKALAQLGIPCYGFAPLRLEPEMPFLSLFHGHDERIPVVSPRLRPARARRRRGRIRDPLTDGRAAPGSSIRHSCTLGYTPAHLPAGNRFELRA